MLDNTQESRVILNNFLQEWPIEKVENMTLEEYVSTDNHHTFCYWVELMAKELGNIRGYKSMKFGIYKRLEPNKKPKKMISDAVYSWQKYYGDTRGEAFAHIKSEVIKIIKLASNGDFNKIDNFKLNPLVRWKIAFLYSGERLIPIYKRSVLEDISSGFNFDVSKKTPYSVLYQVIINNKAFNLSVFEYALALYTKYVLEDKKNLTNQNDQRKDTTKKNTKKHIRKGSKEVVVSQEHNRIQQDLYNWLCKQYGGKKFVKMERNQVDIRVLLKAETIFYEVKSDGSAMNCIKAALGQLFTYVYKDDRNVTKSLVVAGKNVPNENEEKFIKYLKEKLNIDFTYISIEEVIKT